MSPPVRRLLLGPAFVFLGPPRLRGFVTYFRHRRGFVTSCGVIRTFVTVPLIGPVTYPLPFLHHHDPGLVSPGADGADRGL